MSHPDEYDLARLISGLPPTPEALVAAAQEIPRTSRELDDIVARVEADARFRAAVTADLERALVEEGYTTVGRLLPTLRRRLGLP